MTSMAASCHPRSRARWLSAHCSRRLSWYADDLMRARLANVDDRLALQMVRGDEVRVHRQLPERRGEIVGDPAAERGR